MTLENLLKKHFNFSSFRKGQRQAVNSALQGHHTLVMLPTGTGKSLCYQLPSYAAQGLTVIISPLLSLMQDQVETIKQRGEKRVATINSTISSHERRYLLDHLANYRYLFLSPEMLAQPQILHRLKQQDILLFVVDEAHCISQWGIDFRPEYLQIGTAIEKLNNPPVMALTATATLKVQQEIKHYLHLTSRPLDEVIYPVDRSEIYYHVEHCRGDKDEKMLSYLKRLTGAGVIYFRSKKTCDRLAARIQQELFRPVASYHGDIDDVDREKIQQQFLEGTIEIVCATSAFGMGVDKENIRFVIHYHLPDSPEMYLQEVGRASRDQKQGLALLLYEPGDERIHHFFQSQSYIDEQELQAIYQQAARLEAQELTSPVERLILYLAHQHVPFEKAREKISEHQHKKTHQLQFMLSYIYHEGCKRQYLLNYFEEDKQPVTPCCSSCDPEFIEAIEAREAVSSQVQKQKRPHWENILAELFNNISNER